MALLRRWGNRPLASNNEREVPGFFSTEYTVHSVASTWASLSEAMRLSRACRYLLLQEKEGESVRGGKAAASGCTDMVLIAGVRRIGER